MAAKISIVIPVYKAGEALSQILESILAQSLREIELICVNDSSGSGSKQIVEDYSKKDSRVKQISLNEQDEKEAPTKGMAWNKGLEAASGEYLHFMEADDYCLDYAYEVLYNKVKRYELDCIKFGQVLLDEKSQKTLEVKGEGLLKTGDYHRLLDLSQDSALFHLDTQPFTGLYKRAFLMEKGIRFSEQKYGNERSFFIHLISTAPRIMASRDRLVVHRIKNVNASPEEKTECLRALMQSIKEIEEQLRIDRADTGLFRKVISRELDALLEDCLDVALYSKDGMAILDEVDRFLYSREYYFIGEQLKKLKAIRKEAENSQINKEETAGEGKKPEAQKKKAPKETAVFFEECKEPKVSVVVPIYNQEEYLNQALYSLAVQSLKEMEFICVNDGSTDDSLLILKEYANIDKRFRIIDKPNTGYGNSMNVGIDAAKGDYIGILEPDDYVPRDMYGQLYEIAKIHQLDLVKADFYRFGVLEDGTLSRRIARLSQDKSYYNRMIDPGEETKVFSFITNTWSGIYDRCFLKKWNIRHHESPGASFQDVGFWFQTFCRAKRIWFVDKALYMYRKDNPNASMYSSGKFHAHTKEYRFIRNFLSQDPALLEKYEKIFYAKKFNSFSLTYYRLEPSLKKDYLDHICEEFKAPMEEGKLDKALFEPRLWKMLCEILEDPGAYYEKLRLSVIIPAYNAEACIRQCLDSLLARYDIRMEVICVDDGSTDDTLKILKEYEEKDQRVRVLHQENQGAGAARNNGMRLAGGEYLAFLDADDFFDPEMPRRAYEKAHTEDCDVCVFGSDQYFEQKKAYRSAAFAIKNDLLPDKQPFAGSEIRRDIFRAFLGWPWDKLYKADFVRENQLSFQEQRTTNDMLFVFSAIVKAERIALLQLPLAHHRRVDDGKSLSVSREKSWHCFYDALLALREKLVSWGLYERYERDFIDYALHFTLWNLHTLKGDSYFLLYDRLKEEWLRELGLMDKEELYFTDKKEYEALQMILAFDAREYLFARMDLLEDKVGAGEEAVKKAQAEIEKLKADRVELWAVKKERGIEIHALRMEKKERGDTIREQAKVIEAQKKEIENLQNGFASRVERKLKKMLKG